MVSARDCASMLLQTLHPLMRTIRDATRQIRMDAGDTPTMEQFRLMQVLVARPRNLRELAAKHAVSASTMSRSIDVVVQRGWVTRTADPLDRRQVVITLSSEGHALYAAMVKEIEDHLTERLAILDDDERRELHAALAVIGKLLTATSPADQAADCDAERHDDSRKMEQHQ